MSALALATTFGCRVVGVDLDTSDVAAVAQAARASPAGRLVTFEQGDAERLPFEDAVFDAVICECAFCLFPDKQTAASEFARVLRPLGWLGISDLIRDGELPRDLDSILGWVACVADAWPAIEYASLLQGAGLEVRYSEAHPDALAPLLKRVRLRLLALQIAVRLGKTREFEAGEVREAIKLARGADSAVKAGLLGYGTLLARKQAGGVGHGRRAPNDIRKL